MSIILISKARWAAQGEESQNSSVIKRKKLYKQTNVQSYKQKGKRNY